MKNFKRIIAVMLTCIMALTLGVVTGISVSAATTDPDITIIPQDDGYEHQYAAYQIFDGELSTDKNNNLVLSNIVWGTGINSTKTTDLLTEIKAFKDLDDTTPFSAVSSAEDVAKKLSDLRNKYSSDGQSLSTVIDSFSQILSKYLSSTSTTSTKSKTECVISDVDPGYYLITDISATPNPDDTSKSRFMVQIVESVSIDAKAVLPTLDKKIDVDGGVEYNTASIGDDVPFILTSAVPDMTGYEKYFFVVNDTLSNGLSFNHDEVITIGGEVIDPANYTLTETNGVIKIVFKNFIQYQSQKGDDIVIKYSAKVNANADTTSAGNPNTANLTYSNNPNVIPTGENEPTSGDPKGQTPDKKTITYVTKVQILKVDDNGDPLENATFGLSGLRHLTTLTTQGLYVLDDAGTYYRLKDGTFTDEEPSTLTANAYASTKTYKLIEDADEIEEALTISVTATSDENGIVAFPIGVGEGDYTIEELSAPDGYNKLGTPIALKITAAYNTDGSVNWDATISGGTNLSVSDTATLISFKVQNHKGTILPTTGGIGTKLFYIIGSLLVLGSAVIFITKKRMAAAK